MRACKLLRQLCDTGWIVVWQVSGAVNPANETTASFRECVLIRHPRHGEYAFAFITGTTVLQVRAALPPLSPSLHASCCLKPACSGASLDAIWSCTLPFVHVQDRLKYTRGMVMLLRALISSAMHPLSGFSEYSMHFFFHLCVLQSCAASVPRTA